MKLDVRVAHAGAAADEAAALEVIAGAEAVPGEEPARADERAAHQRNLRVKRDGLAAGDLKVELQVILQVLAHTRQLAHHVDAVGGELVSRADARQHQQLGRIDRTGAQDHLAPCAHLVKEAAAPITDADRPTPFEQYARGERVRAHRQVAPAHRRTQVGIRGAAAPAAAHGHVQVPESFLLKAVHVGGQRVAGLPPRLQPGRVQRVGEKPAARLERAIAAAVLIASLGAAFRALEVRQHILIAPAGGAFGLPALEVERVAAHVHQPVDRGGPAEHLAARGVQSAAIQVRLRLGVVAPVVARHVHRNRQRAGHLDPRRAVRAAVLEHQYAVLAVLGETIRQHAARGAGADDQVVDGLHGPSRARRRRPWRHTRSSVACNARWRRGRSRARDPTS